MILSYHAPYLSTLEMRFFIIRYYTNQLFFAFTLLYMMNVEHCQVAAKPPNLGCESSSCRLLLSAPAIAV